MDGLPTSTSTEGALMSRINARAATVTQEFDEIGAQYDRLTGLSPADV